MKFDSIKPQTFLNSLSIGGICKQTEETEFPLCSEDD